MQKFAPVATIKKRPAAEVEASNLKASKLDEESTDGYTTDYATDLEDPNRIDLD